MNKFRQIALGLLVCASTLPSFAAILPPLAPGANLTSAVENASPGDTIQLSAGDYYPSTTSAWADGNAFGITKAVKIVGLGSSPGDVRLHGGNGIDYAVKFTRYIYAFVSGVAQIGNPSGALIENLTIDGGNGGIMIWDPSYATVMSDITVKNVSIQTVMSGNSVGVLLNNTQRVVLDNVSVTSFNGGFQFVNANDSLMMNSAVISTTADNSTGIAVLGGANNIIVNNTIGSPKADPALDSNYSIQTDGVVFYNSHSNRLENNTMQGHRIGGLDFHAKDLTPSVATQKSTDNYAGKNNIISTGFKVRRTAGGGMWVNCSSDNTWLYANDAQGGAEGGLSVWHSENTMVLANSYYDNQLNGIGISGGEETAPLDSPGLYCPILAYHKRPSHTFLNSNNVYYNGNEQINIRKSDATQVFLNSLSYRNGFGGATQPCLLTECQTALVLQGDPADSSATSNGVVAVANTSLDNPRGLLNDDGKITGMEFFGNRVMFSRQNRFVSSGQNLDWGQNLGGNYWSQHTASGNPSTSTPYTGVFQNTQNHTGAIVDRYPFQTEDIGRGFGVTVYEPYPGSVARGTRRTVRWYAPGCSYVDVSVDGSSDILTNHPNTGYAVVTVPDSAGIGAHIVVVKCKDSSGLIRGQGSSASINVSDGSLKLLSPGRDDVFNAGDAIFVAWKKTASVPSVDIYYSTDKGVTFLPLLLAQTGTFARVTLPSIASTAYFVIKIKSGSTFEDSTDGVFAVRGTSGAGFANVSAGRKFVMGQLERLEWASPQNSRLVDITATVGGTTKSVATNLPDRGNFDWVVPDLGAGAMQLNISFKSTSGAALSSAPTSQGSTLYPTTITFGPAQPLTPGGAKTVSATTNSGAVISFSSLTPSICTVLGTTVSGVSNGTCTIAANAPATGNYSAAPQVTQYVTVGATQTISFGTAPTLVIYGTAAVSAVASSSLPVALTSLTTSVCDISGATVSGLALGTCIIAANQAGDNTYGTAVQVTQSFEVVLPTTIPRLANISTRGQVQTGDNVMIGGFIISGASPKTVLIRAGGPSMAGSIQGVLSDTRIDLYSGSTVIASNDNWGNATNASAIQTSTLAPANPFESAILTSLPPGPYTAIVSGVNNGTGVGIIEVFEIDHAEYQLINISTRGKVQTGDNVMIGGFIIQGSASKTVLIRAGGPSMAGSIPGVLENPKIDLYSGSTVIASNDDWGSADNSAAVQASGLAPTDPRESAILITLPPGAYTAIVKGADGGTGVGIVEVFAQ